MDSESVRFEDLLTQLEQQRQAMEKDRAEAARLKQQAESDARKAREFRDQMERARQNVRGKAEKDARRILADARAEAEQTFETLNQMRAQPQEALDVQRQNEERAALMGRLRAAEEQLHRTDEEVEEPRRTNSRPIRQGDTVELRGVKTRAKVIQVSQVQ